LLSIKIKIISTWNKLKNVHEMSVSWISFFCIYQKGSCGIIKRHVVKPICRGSIWLANDILIVVGVFRSRFYVNEMN